MHDHQFIEDETGRYDALRANRTKRTKRMVGSNSVKRTYTAKRKESPKKGEYSFSILIGCKGMEVLNQFK